MCTHAPGGDVKINVVSLPPIIHPLPPSFPLQRLQKKRLAFKLLQEMYNASQMALLPVY